MKLFMKKTILFLLCCLTLCTSIKAQTIFAPPNSKWYCEDVPEDIDYGDSYIKYETIKDTMFEGKLCSKIVGKKVQLNRTTNKYDTTYQNNEYTYTQGDTVFYYNHIFKQFFSLYIFNVKVGDTISYHIPYPATSLGYLDTIFKVRIDSIKFVTIDGQALKKIWANGIPDYDAFDIGPYVERIGAIGGRILIGHTFRWGLPHGGRLRCYSDGVIEENFIIGGFPCEYLNTTGIDEIFTKNNFLIYPNPNLGTVNIKNNSFNSKINIVVYNVLGELLQSMEYSGKSVISIDIEKYPSTNFIVLIYDEKKNLLFKSHISKIN